MSESHAFRMTRHRRVILEVLRRTRKHPTAEELYILVRRRLPRVSLATVYRNLEVLSEQGLIRKLETAGRQMRFDGTVSQHYHIRCIRCGRVEDVPVEPASHLERQVRRKSGWQVMGHTLEFFGLCPACRAKGRRR